MSLIGNLVSNHFLEVTYEIENNCLEKTLSIFQQKIENLILGKCMIGI